MRKKYKIYSVILTGIILTGCKSVRMTSQDRQQFMPNGISVASQISRSNKNNAICEQHNKRKQC